VATVSELSGPYENFLVAPRRGSGVCAACFNLTRGFEYCYSCSRSELWLSAVLPISYSVGREQLHHALSGYKRLAGDVARRLTVEIAAVLWRFIAIHERCLARAAGVPSFKLVTTVPSSDPARDGTHPLRRIAGELVGPIRGRYEPLLQRSQLEVPPRQIHVDKFEPTRKLANQAVLLVDDTWTTGANARSAAAALMSAGAGPVAAVVVGRYLNRTWHENDCRLRDFAGPFNWNRCALCADAA
jgi:hypothetical protein